LAALREGGAVAPHTPWKEISFHRQVPCEKCDGGYRGRIGVQEVWPISRNMKEMITQHTDLQDLQQIAYDEGMLTLAEDGIYKATQGYTTIEEVLRIAAQ